MAKKSAKRARKVAKKGARTYAAKRLSPTAQKMTDWVATLDVKELRRLQQLQVVVESCERIDNPSQVGATWIVLQHPPKKS